MAQSARPGFAPPSSTTPCSGKHGDRRAQDDKKRQFLYACEDGCFPCVERLVLWEGVAPDSSSDTQGFSGLDFAEWGKTKGHGRHEDVITFLHDQICVKQYMGSRQWVVLRQATGPPPPPPPLPHLFHRHLPYGGRKPRSSKYKLFHAAKDGCLECVERLVLVEGVAADALSDTHRYSALDFAEWGEEQEIEGRHADVISFLQEQLSSARGSTAPEPDEVPPCRLPWVRD